MSAEVIWSARTCPRFHPTLPVGSLQSGVVSPQSTIIFLSQPGSLPALLFVLISLLIGLIALLQPLAMFLCRLAAFPDVSVAIHFATAALLFIRRTFPSTLTTHPKLLAAFAKEALIKSPLRKSDPVSTIEIHLPLKSKSFLRHPSNLKFGQDFQLRLNQRFPKGLTAFPGALAALLIALMALPPAVNRRRLTHVF